MDNALDQLKTVASRALLGRSQIGSAASGTITIYSALQTKPVEMPLQHTIYVQKLRVVVLTAGSGITWTFQDSNGTPVPVGPPNLDMSVVGEIVFDFGPQGVPLTKNKNLVVVLSGAGAAADVYVEGYQLPDMDNGLVIPSFASIAPASGSAAGGTAVAIFGAGFKRGATVTIGGVAVTNVQWISPQELLGVTGAHAAGAVNVVITNPAPNSETVTGAGAFTYV